MEAQYWHDKWAAQDIGWHQKKPNHHLQHHLSVLQLKTNDHVFVPLCGKTHDVGWLLNQGYRVTGIELNESAVQALFESLSLTPNVSETPSLKQYQAGPLTVWVGDVFLLTAEQLGSVQASYDRAALVALPPDMRKSYTQHLQLITGGAQQLLITFDYDQNAMAGPPHSVPAEEVNKHYANSYQLNLLISETMEDKLKGRVEAVELVWHLT